MNKSIWEMLIILLVLSFSDSFSQSFTHQADLSEEGFKVYFFETVPSKTGGVSNLLVYYGNKKNEKYVLYDSAFTKIEEREIGKHITRWKNYFRSGDKVYIFEKKLFVINLLTLELDSLKYDWEYTRTCMMNNTKEGNKEFVIADTRTAVDVYDLNTLQKISEVKRSKSLRNVRSSKLKGTTLILWNEENELTAVDIFNGDKICLLNTGSSSVGFLGIGLGSMENRIQNILIAREKDSAYVVASTHFGDLYKVNLMTVQGEEKESSVSNGGNNSGLLTSLYCEDVNGDGCLDYIGAAVDEHFYCFDGRDFSVLWEYDSGEELQMPLALYDINGDGVRDVFGVNDYDNILTVLDGKSGELIAEMEIKESDKFFQTSPFVKDFNEKGYATLMVKTKSENLKIFKIGLSESNGITD